MADKLDKFAPMTVALVVDVQHREAGELWLVDFCTSLFLRTCIHENLKDPSLGQGRGQEPA